MYRADKSACDLIGPLVIVRGVTVSLIAIALASAIQVASPMAAGEIGTGVESLQHVQMGSEPSAPSSESEAPPPERSGGDSEPGHLPEAYSYDGDELEDDYPAGSSRDCPYRQRNLELIV